MTSYFPIQKSRVKVTGNRMRWNVPAVMRTMLVTGTGTGTDTVAGAEPLDDSWPQPEPIHSNAIRQAEIQD